jgi:hypothetical protein
MHSWKLSITIPVTERRAKGEELILLRRSEFIDFRISRFDRVDCHDPNINERMSPMAGF